MILTGEAMRIHEPVTVPSTHAKEEVSLLSAVQTGLSAKLKTLPSWCFYDDIGSLLFRGIMELNEYYLTRCELQIVRNNARAIHKLISKEPFRLIELGAGDGTKTRILTSTFMQHNRLFTYYPIDISEEALRELSITMDNQPPELRPETKPLLGDYFDCLDSLTQNSSDPNVILFLGSNIGNMNSEETKKFLTYLNSHMHQGDLIIIGWDLQKDTAIMEAAL